jgi:glycosyltransferase involved in cell wall biosynthesis
VTLVSLSGDGPLRERFERAGVRIASFPLGGLFTRGSLRQAMRLRALLREREVEIVHSQDMYSNVFATAAARAAGTPVVITSRRWHAFERPAFRVANAAAFHLSSCVVANSPLVAALTHRGERVPTRRLEVVPNFVDDAAFDAPAAAERERFRAELGVPQGALVVGVVANLWKEKDQATLVRALARLGARAPEVHVVLVGEGPLRATLVRICPVCRNATRWSPTRTGTAESHMPAKHVSVFGSNRASSSTFCCICRQAAQGWFAFAISAQNGFSLGSP